MRSFNPFYDFKYGTPMYWYGNHIKTVLRINLYRCQLFGSILMLHLQHKNVSLIGSNLGGEK